MSETAADGPVTDALTGQEIPLMAAQVFPATRRGVADWHIAEATRQLTIAGNWRRSAEQHPDTLRCARLKRCAELALDAARLHKAFAEAILTDPPPDDGEA